MTENVNPNSRAPFTTADGRLTKYGMDVIASIYRALELVGNTSVINDIKNQLGDLSFLPAILSKNTAIDGKINDLEAQIPDTFLLLARIQQLEEKIADLERDSQPIFPVHAILQRLDAIEAQL